MPSAAPSAGLDQAFDQLGLTSTERRAYTFLLETGTASPTQIADATGQSRGRIYETLRSLVERGLAREEPRRPVRYAPVPPAEVIAGALETAQRTGQELREAYATLARAAPPTAPSFAPTKAGDVAVLQGRPAVHAEMRRLIGRAREFVELEGRAALASRVAADEALGASLKEARRRGVEVRIHVGPGLEAKTRQSLEAVVGNGRVVIGDQPAPVVSLATEAAVLVAVPQPDDAATEGDDVGYRAESPALAHAVRARFASAGGPPSRLAFATLPEAAAAARRTFDVLGPHAWGSDLQAAAPETASALRSARTRGVAVRLLVTGTRRPAEVPGIEVRTAPWAPSRFALVDGTVHHFVEADVPARASDDPREVRFYRDLFERMWNVGADGS